MRTSNLYTYRIHTVLNQSYPTLAPEEAMEELWNKLCERLYEELNKRIPDLRWFNLEVHFLDSIEDLEKAAFLSQAFP
jgi:hypothetical protein